MLLWPIIEDVTGAAIFRSLAGSGRGSCEAEDLRQDFFVYLLEHASPFATSFRGTSVPELRRYLWVAAVRFARKRSGRARRAHVRESEASARHDVGSPGPNDAEIALAVAELDAILTGDERNHLHMVLEVARVRDTPDSETTPPCEPPSSRTVRRWGEAIFRKYTDRV